MHYKCKECGNVFEEGEQATWEEHHPYGMGYATETFSGCPVCEGSYKEIEPCKICGTLDHDIEESFCDVCKEEFEKNLEFVLSQNFSEAEIELFHKLYE